MRLKARKRKILKLIVDVRKRMEYSIYDVLAVFGVGSTLKKKRVFI